MKKTLKLIGLMAVAGCLLFAAGCSKTKTCTCTITVSMYGVTHTETVTGEYDGDCKNMPEVKAANAALGGLGTISCK